MPRHTPRTKTFVMPEITDRFPAGNPPDGYVVTFSGTDGYYYPRPTSKLLLLGVPSAGGPHTITTEDLVLVPSHSGTYIVNLPVAPPIGFHVFVKDFAGVALANPINVVAAANIDGTSPYIINVNYGGAHFVFNGATWSIISKF